MLTADEIRLAGNSTDSYLHTGYTYWTMTPDYYVARAFNYYVSSEGILLSPSVTSSNAVRPSISLKIGTLVSLDSDGTKEKPYEVIIK